MTSEHSKSEDLHRRKIRELARVAAITLMIVAVCCLTSTLTIHAQSVRPDIGDAQFVGVAADLQKKTRRKTLRVVKSPAIVAVDQPTFARLRNVQFHNGTITVRVLSRLLRDAPELARGFIGVAFRINDDNSKFECIYVRPQNARVDDQLRRNHTIQYFSFPDYSFERLRKEVPGVYESWCDMGLDEWIDLRIEVHGTRARLFINGAKQAALVVNDLKHGAGLSGGIGLWVDVGTEGLFTDLRIQHEK